MVNIKSFINSPVDSVTYILSNPDNAEALVIDPGTQDDERISSYIEENKLKLMYIFLTHEHFDHILGVNFLRSRFHDVKVVSSEKTSERLVNPKKNLAIFHNQINLVVNKSDINVEEGKLKMIGLEFEVFRTPGHTDSSISLKLGNSFFSGDFLLQGTRIVTNLPTGCKTQYKESVEKYSAILDKSTVFPGHGGKYIYKK
ncbi:MBL fold metallo-hydrolase [Chryseobacterium foetidum]|uniref:MBL fold metallo-hydrolase n=1 Tax=Chryseobacterium foetidum TaxID=2951057 RepID=UPI0021C710B0|nr:MBL fold metallo-hydrolase [Chryseobacterium foetidum]